jgi:hypothetical protein
VRTSRRASTSRPSPPLSAPFALESDTRREWEQKHRKQLEAKAADASVKKDAMAAAAKEFHAHFDGERHMKIDKTKGTNRYPPPRSSSPPQRHGGAVCD